MRILIVGGVAGGASAATRLRRLNEHAEIVIFERGPYISFANCGLPYHMGGEIKERESLLLTTPEEMKKRYNIHVRVNTEVVSIDREKRMVKVRESHGKEWTEKYDKLILSPGARPLLPAIPNLKDNPRIFFLRTLPELDKIMEFIKKENPKKVLVVGGGYIGLEAAENLKKRGLEVTLVEMLPQVMLTLDPEMAAIVQNHLILNGVELILNDGVKEFENTQNGLKTTLTSGKVVEHHFAVFAAGVLPEVSLAKEAGLEIGSTGAIRVNESMQTSDPHIYAVGDAVEVRGLISGKKVWLPLAGPAVKQARVAADSICGIKRAYQGSQGTTLVKVFDICAGTTGLNEKQLEKEGMAYKSVIVHPSSHASYYPESKTVSIKLLFNSENGKILGAQVVGEKGADKRLDVIATAIRAGMTVWDLANLELGYAPPFGNAKDPVNIAGFVASNVLEGTVNPISVQELDRNREDYHLLDVRSAEDFEIGHIPGAVNIPLPQLRSRLKEIPKDKKIAVYCKVGMTSYLATRILMQNGFKKVYNLSGGWTTWSFLHKWKEAKTP